MNTKAYIVQKLIQRTKFYDYIYQGFWIDWVVYDLSTHEDAEEKALATCQDFNKEKGVTCRVVYKEFRIIT